MGIIKKILVAFSLLVVCSLSAQTASDTIVFDGETYVKHIVKAGESLKLIALLHKVTTADIIENNEIHKRLYYNQLLYIPIYENQQKSKDKVVSLNVQEKIELATALMASSEHLTGEYVEAIKLIGTTLPSSAELAEMDPKLTQNPSF